METRLVKLTPAASLLLAPLLMFALARCVPAAAAQEQPPPPNAATEAHLGRGYEAEKDERYQEAAQEFQAALALNPGLVRARYQLAVCWFALGKMPEARAEFTRVAKETGGDPRVVYYLARVDLRTGDTGAAIGKFTQVVNDPPFSDTAYYLGSAYLEGRKFEQAEKWLQIAARADPHDYRVCDHLARVYQQEGRKADAERQFDLSARLRQRHDRANEQAVACSQLLETKPLDVAQAACRQLFDPNDPDMLTTLGLLYGQHGLYAEAVPPLEEAGRLDPESFEIQHDLGLTYFRLRRYTNARAALEKAVDLRPDFFGSNALLGATLYALGDDEPAYKVLCHAHALNPDDRDTASLLFQQALILANREETQKKYDLAIIYLRKAQHLQPENQDVQRRLAELARLLGPEPALKRKEKDLP